MKYWLKTFNHLNMHKDVFSNLEVLKERLSLIIHQSEDRFVVDLLKEAKRLFDIGRIDVDEFKDKCKEATSWKGFTNIELYGKVVRDEKDIKLPSIKIVSFPDDLGFDGKLFLEG